MRKVIFIMLFLLLNNFIFSQDFGLTAKYYTHMGNSYDAYTTISLEGVFSLYDNLFEVGPIMGLSYSELSHTIIEKTLPEFYSMGYTDIYKSFIGGIIYFFPIKHTYSPYIALKGVVLQDTSFPLFGRYGGGMIWGPGYYNINTKNDHIYSVLGGLKITTKVINVVLGLEYQQRNFTLEYDEQKDDYGIDVIEHSKKRSITAYNFSIGFQYMF